VKLCHQSKIHDAKTTIVVFTQGVSETLYETWERYKSMLRKCPSHKLNDITQIYIFRHDLQQLHKLMHDATT